MEQKVDVKNEMKDINCVNDGSEFPHVTAVATRWTLDFMFLSLCRYFKENNLEEFDVTVAAMDAICQSPSLKAAFDDQQLVVCAFLGRVMHGKQLDTQYDQDDRMMPLMSAAKIWSEFKDTVADKSLFKKMSNLLIVQSVAVSLEKGQRLSASSALKWFEENYELPKGLRVMLSTIVTERDTHHTLLRSHSFSRLREMVQSFLDDYLEKNPSDYLLKAATKVVQSSKTNGGLNNLEKQDSFPTETSKDSKDDIKEEMETRQVTIKRKLTSTKINDLWKPDSCKKAVVHVKRIPILEKPQRSKGTSEISKTRAARQKWTAELDKLLQKGVRRHGIGRWAQILLDYDFEGRSSTMLKDRWRVLVRAHKVG